MSQQITVTINGFKASVDSSMTIMDAARSEGFYIPSLCHHPDQRVKANCRVCSVEIEGRHNLATACSTRVQDGMVIRTNTPRVRETVRTILELIFADHPQECVTCIRNGNCELRQLAARYAITHKKSAFSICIIAAATPVLPPSMAKISVK